LEATDIARAAEAIAGSGLVVDALVGYGLSGDPQGRARDLIELCNRHATRVVSLDVPSGFDVSAGRMRTPAVCAHRRLTLALPKTGTEALEGEIFLADIGIPLSVYKKIGLNVAPFFDHRYWVPLGVAPGEHGQPGRWRCQASEPMAMDMGTRCAFPPPAEGLILPVSFLLLDAITLGCHQGHPGVPGKPGYDPVARPVRFG
jgi:hypothetical protein